MPSWQSRLLQLGIRLLIKRRVQGNEAELAAFARKKLADPRFAERMTPKDVCLEQVQENSIKGEWVWWKEEPAKYTIFYLHGGGYVACSPENYRPFTAELARQSGARIFALDYRLAPEHRFPAPVDDAVKAYRWLLAKGERPDNLVIGGDSAGGGLTIATLTALRDAGDPLPAAAFCFSPWTDLAGTGNSMMTNDRRDPMFYGASLPLFAKLYLADAS